MKTILHLPSWEALQRVPADIIAISHLTTYGVATMNGEYAPRVVVHKNRGGNQGISISFEQLQILQDAVLNDKPMPEFMKSEGEKAKDKKYSENLRNMWNNRLVKLEGDLFPNESWCCINTLAIDMRLSRIEKKLGVVQSPGDNLGRLEDCENTLRLIDARLNSITREVYPTSKYVYDVYDVYDVRPVATLEDMFRRLEEKLGVTMAFTDLIHRLVRILDAWECTKAAIARDFSIDRMKALEGRITKLEDALIPEGFATDPTNPELAIMRLYRLQKKVGIQHPQQRRLESQIEQLEYHVYHNITKWKQPEYVCFDCRVTFKAPGACPHCRKGLISCGKQWRFPKKSDVKDWKKVFEMIMKNAYFKEMYESSRK